MTQQTNAEIIAKELYEAGVRYVFGQPGGEVVDLMEALAQAGIEFVLMGHESAAALAAGTMGWATDIPGVCLTTLGPGACNLTLGLGEALLERHPLLAISARTDDEAPWYNHQRLPLNEMFTPISKDSIALTAHACDEQLQYALAKALHPPCGPVYLSLPGPVAAQPPNPHGSISQTMDVAPETDEAMLSTIAEAVNKAKRPVVVVGLALDQRQDVAAVRDFLANTGLPYADSPKIKGLVDPHASGYLGTYLSASGDSIINQTIAQSDCILGIGFDPVETTYDWHLAENYYSVAQFSTAFGSFMPAHEVLGDVSALLRTLQEQFEATPDWQPADFARIRAQVATAISPPQEVSEKGLAPLTVATCLQSHLPAEVRLTVDTGQHKMLFSQAWQTDTPLSYFCSNGLSSMGVALPGAIALALLDRTRPVVAVMGDGCFNSMVQELETIQRLGLAPLIVVLCDQLLSLIRIPQQMRDYPARGIEFAPVDWAMVATGYGVKGVWAKTIPDLNTAIADWVQHPQATVLAVEIDEALYCGNAY